MTYRQALMNLKGEGYNLVKTNGYDQDINDKLHSMDVGILPITMSLGDNGVFIFEMEEGRIVFPPLAQVVKAVKERL